MTTEHDRLDAADLLLQGDDRERWRPRRGHVLAVVVVAVLGSVAVLGQRVLRERHLDAASRADVRLALSGDVVNASDLLLQITSRGRHRVEVESVSVPGTTTPYLISTLDPGEATDYPLTVARCPAHEPPAPRTADVVVRTSRGLTVRRTLPLPSEVSTLVQTSTASACGFPAGSALVWGLQGSGMDGRTLVMDVELRNVSLLPLTLERFRTLPGLRVEGPVGTTLAATAPGSPPTTLMASVRVTVNNCRQFMAITRTTSDAELALDVEVGGRHGTVGLGLGDVDGDLVYDDLSPRAGWGDLRRTCR